MLGTEHPSTLTCMAKLALTYKNQGRYKEAEELEVQLLERRKRVLGAEHPSTLTSVANLALTYTNQGRWTEAEQLEVQVMETRKRVLGEGHPDTLSSMANLASMYRDQGRWEQAEELEVQVMEMRKRTLGAKDHHELLVHEQLFPRIIESPEPTTRGSEISNDVSAPPSVIFSLQTVLSTAITGNSLLTHAEMKKATDELVSIFLDNQELEMLYRVAIDDKRIGPGRFARNFKRLLKVFLLDLKKEIRDAVDLELVNLISSKAGFVATGIRQVLEPVLVSPQAIISDGTKEEPTSEVNMKNLPMKGLRIKNARNATVVEEESISGRIRTEELPNEERLPSKEDIDVSSNEGELEGENNERFTILVA